MPEELKLFERNQVLVLVPPPLNCHLIGTKWVFKNNESEDVLVVRKRRGWLPNGFARKRVLILRPLPLLPI
jgi:hypothetical protein